MKEGGEEDAVGLFHISRKKGLGGAGRVGVEVEVVEAGGADAATAAASATVSK